MLSKESCFCYGTEQRYINTKLEVQIWAGQEDSLQNFKAKTETQHKIQAMIKTDRSILDVNTQSTEKGHIRTRKIAEQQNKLKTQAQTESEAA